MKIIVTLKDILYSGHWEEFCEERNYNLWIINEGLANSDDEVTLTKEEAEKYGLL